MSKLRAAIIGCGAIHKTHAQAIIDNPNAELVSVVDIDAEKAEQSAKLYNCRYFTDYKDMLNDKEIDVVHLCTPHYLHAPMAIDSMLAGKHVLTEKPAAIKSSDVMRMAEVSKNTGKSLGVCFQNRFNNTSARIKEILSSGKAGKILGAKAMVTWKRDEEYYASGYWRGTWEMEGGGVLINQSIHTLDLLQWFCGDVVKIKGSYDTRLLKHVIEVEDTAEATLIFKNGSAGLFYATNCYAAHSPVEIEIICENALIKLSDNLTITYKSGETEHVSDSLSSVPGKSYWGSGHAVLIDEFYNCILEQRPFLIGPEEGVKTIKLIEGIYESAGTGEYVVFE